MSDVAEVKELADWWQDILEDLEPDTTTFTLTMRRAMAQRNLDAARRWVRMVSSSERVWVCRAVGSWWVGPKPAGQPDCTSELSREHGHSECGYRLVVEAPDSL